MKLSRKSFSVLVIAVLAMLMLFPGAASAAPASSTSAAPTAGGPPPCCWYQVRWGDTLSRIASRYGVSTTYLQQLNGIANRNYIRAGQWLQVPCGYYYGAYPYRHYYWNSYYHCWGYSYWNAYYGKYIFICTG